MISTSGSNWLDRLRSSRGFPTGSEPDLDRFISLSSSSGSAESSTHMMREKTPQWTPPPGEFATVLSDLFNMGGDVSKQQQQRKKACRKQPNPRFFNLVEPTELPSSSENGGSGFISSDDHSFNTKLDKNNNNKNRNVGGEDTVVVAADVVDNNQMANANEVVLEDDSFDLREYSRSEVTVIDTSFEEWKSDKWVFRKNGEWKIKEKNKCRFKTKVSVGGTNNIANNKTPNKKRKLLVNKLGDNNNNNKIKINTSTNKLDEDDGQLMKKKDKMEDELPNKRQPRIDKGSDSFQKRQAYLGKVPQKRFPCPRPPKKQKNEGSPVILIKSIPLNDNTAAMKTGKTSQKNRQKKMKII